MLNVQLDTKTWIERQEAIGYCAFYRNIAREQLPNKHQQRGWDDAHGCECFYRALEREAAYDQRTAWMG
jgi:hypothetical protein